MMGLTIQRDLAVEPRLGFILESDVSRGFNLIRNNQYSTSHDTVTLTTHLRQTETLENDVEIFANATALRII